MVNNREYSFSFPCFDSVNEIELMVAKSQNTTQEENQIILSNEEKMIEKYNPSQRWHLKVGGYG